MSDITKHIITSLSPEKRELLLRRLSAKKSHVGPPPIHHRRRELDSFPLSSAQQRLWFLEQLEPGSPAYTMPAALRLSGWLSMQALEYSLQHLVQRHESLRTIFISQQGTPAQVIIPRLIVSMPVIDLKMLPRQKQEEQLQLLAQQDAHLPFNLAKGSLLRVHLLQLGEKEYVLLVNMHHIISDGWSIGILIRELTTLYKAYLSGEAITLPPLPVQYVDYTLWQQEWLQGEPLQEQLSYWQRQLAHAPTALDLPTDHPRSSMQSHAGTQQMMIVSPTLYRALERLGQREDATLFMVLLASLQVLLMRYSGQQDIIIGTPVANRAQKEVEALIGFFVNTLAIRTDLSGDPCFRELLARVREVALQAYAHQDLPFEQLVAHLPIERSLSYSPLFQVLFSLEPTPRETISLEALTVQMLEIEHRTSKFDLTIEAQTAEQGLWVEITYRTDLFEASTIQRLQAHWLTLLESVAADPEQRISALALLTVTEREQLLFDWTDTHIVYASDGALHEHIERQVEQSLDAVAVVYEEGHLTYSALNRYANRVAHALQRLNVGPDMPVGICLKRSTELVIALLASLKAGGAFLPLDPDYPQERLAGMLHDAQVSVVVTHSTIQDCCPHSDGLTLLCLDTAWQDLPAASTNLRCAVQPDHLAYVIYTSGSTGRPKGAMNTHRGICNRLLWMQETYQLTEIDRVLQKTPYSFDVSVWEFFWPLMTGARLVLAVPGGHQDPSYLQALMSKQAITTLHFVPAMLQAFLEKKVSDQCRDVRQVICSGEALSVELQERFFALRPEGVNLHNLYGPTEAAIDITFWECQAGSGRRIVPIGRPIANTSIYVLDRNLRLVPVGVAGELCIGGVGLARGYLHQADVTAEKFIPHPFSEQPGERLYRTGDLVRYAPDGTLEFLGRIDHQVKIRGNRIELGEIEAVLGKHPGVKECVVIVREDVPGDKLLVAYVISEATDIEELKVHAQRFLPAYMLPALFVVLPALPLLSNGKVDRRALPAPRRPETSSGYVEPQTEIEQSIVAVWREVLPIDQIGLKDNFFDLGGHSLSLVKVHERLRRTLQPELTLVDLFQYPTVEALARFLRPKEIVNPLLSASKGAMRPPQTNIGSTATAIIGIAGRFPNARDVEQFWRNLQQGEEAISFFSDDELLATGVDPHLLAQPNFVRAGAILEDIAAFDASFFGYSPREAEIIDPQQRLFLECSWQALENAGYNPETYPGEIGVYAGSSINTYLISNLLHNKMVTDTIGFHQLLTGNGNDFLTTRVSYKMNLRGPSMTIQTACSTSLVAVHMACESLRLGECDMALAGGVSISVPQKRGYLYEEGSIGSPDGHCRAFDVSSEGTVEGEGVGVVVLKRLELAQADGDFIYAVIKGSAITNDGNTKVGYTASSVQGQANAIAKALAMAQVDPGSVSYIEAHGTGTPLGDPIEIAALRQVYGSDGNNQHCAIGSVKTNIGHLDAAAGIAGLLKTVLALQHQQIPPSLHFIAANPALELSRSPFYVNATLRLWSSNGQMRRAGISSFGMGGTNAHVIVEEAPPCQPASSSTQHQLIILSARSEGALNQMRINLIDYLSQPMSQEFADVAYTLQVGRKAFKHRLTVVCTDVQDTIRVLSDPHSPQIRYSTATETRSRLVFLFPGQGTQYVQMGKDLYQIEASFRAAIDTCAELLQDHLHLDLRTILYPSEEQSDVCAEQLSQTWLTQPALFAIEYALAQTWIEFGLIPQAMIGHSIGEYVAACLAGVFSLADALALVAARGRLMQETAPGAMLMVALSEATVQEYINSEFAELSLAAHNGEQHCTLSGPLSEIERLEQHLQSRGIFCRRLQTSHAFHSRMMNPILERFRACVQKVTLYRPQSAYISNLTGTWITAEQATSLEYWVEQLRQPVRFAEGLQALLQDHTCTLLEVGPGHTLATLARRHQARTAQQAIFTSLRHAQEQQSDRAFLLTTCGQLWSAGAALNWEGLHMRKQRRRIPLPTYPFERHHYWIPPDIHTRQGSAVSSAEFEQDRSEERGESGASRAYHNRPELSTAYVTPRSNLEQQITNIWQTALGIEQIGIHDNFFELNGDSLLATQVVAHIRKELHIEVAMRALFETPTIMEMTRHIAQMQPSEPVSDAYSLSVVERTQKIPLSFAQQRLWFLDQLDPGNIAYNLPTPFRLVGNLNVHVLEKSFRAVIQRHEILRSTFHMRDGEPVQIINEPVFFLPVIDISDLQAAQQEDWVTELMRQHARYIFNLHDGPLFDIAVLRLQEDIHVCLLTVHHMVSDGWSTVILERELVQVYNALSQGTTPALAPLPIQYAEYATWQRQPQQQEILRQQTSYWTQQLADLVTLDLPTDHPRPAMPSTNGRQIIILLPQALGEALQALSQREEVTLFMTLLSAFQTLLYHYTGQSDIAVGTTIATRGHAELENLIGFFVNTLVLRNKLDVHDSFLHLLPQVRVMLLQAYIHQDVPFEQVVEALQPERDMSRSALFQVLFVLQNKRRDSEQLEGLQLQPLDNMLGAAQYDLTFFVTETADGLSCMAEYATDLFEADTIQHLLSHWQHLLEEIVKEPERKLSEFSLLTEAERELMLVTWNATEAAGPQGCIHHIFERQVERSSDAIALSYQEKHLTYAELNSRANQVAHHLRALGVGPEIRVGLSMERSFDLIIGQLGIFKSGGVYVPLDPGYVQERLAFMLNDASISVLLTQQHLASLLPVYSVQYVFLDDDWEKIACRSKLNPTGGARGENAAYVIYTSGSTGQPKGVQVEHGGLSNMIGSQLSTFQVQPHDRMLHVFSPSFDGAIFELCLTLMAGAPLCLPEPGTVLTGSSLSHLLDRFAITTIAALPSVLADLPADRLPLIEKVISAGEALSASVLNTWAAGRYFFNSYGPTEGTVCASAAFGYECCTIQHSSVGRPIANTQIYLLDRALQPVPIGVIGELCFSGPGLARGYLNRPDLTAERFIPNPFSRKPGSRLYRTGDLARYLADGRIEYVGRLDEQVKLRGYRIELREIEAVLNGYPEVQQCAVLLLGEETQEKQLVAYVVTGEWATDTASASRELRSYLKRKLPDYMVPARFVFLDALPLTANGKVDRRKLASCSEWDTAQQKHKGRREQLSSMEELVQQIFRDVLHLEEVGREGNFFELGGHSLLATQMNSRLRRLMGVEVPLQFLFESPTVAELAQRLQQALLQGHEAPAPLIVPAIRNQQLPLSFAQQRLWFLDQLDPQSTAYNIPIAVQLHGRLDRTALEKALIAVIRRHENLRTTFPSVQGAPVQRIAPDTMTRLVILDLHCLPEEHLLIVARQLAQQEAEQPFDLAQGPLLRCYVVQLGTEDQVLLLTMHHIISDIWSMNILVQELGVLYQAVREGTLAKLPEQPVQYADYALWQRQWLQGEVLERHLSYWKQQLAGVAPLELPTDHPRPPIVSFQGARNYLLLDSVLSEQLRQFAQREGVTLFMLLLTAFQALLARYSGQYDIAVGTPIANRTREEIEGLVGFFVNTLVLRTDLSGNPSFLELLACVRRVTLEAYAYQDIPFEQIVEVLQPERDPSRSPLFQVVFALQNVPQPEGDLAGLTLHPFDISSPTAKFDLTLWVEETPEGLYCTAEYNTDLFEAATISRFMEQWQTLLKQALAHPEQRLTTIPILTEAQYQQQLVVWNDTTTDYSRELCLQTLFEAQTKRAPNSIALVFQDAQLTYSELNRRANQLAHYLHNAGVGPDVVVGICMERSIEMIVGFLGILKAGGAYLPLDPSYPAERQAFMLQDANAALLVTQQQLIQEFPHPGIAVICLDTDEPHIRLQAEEDLRLTMSSEHLAYVIYTSGSTGKPKGICIPHRAVNRLLFNTNYVQVEATDRIAQASNASFDAATFEIWGALLYGAQLIGVAKEILLSPQEFAAFLQERAISTLFLTTALFNQVASQAPGAFSTLRHLLFGGEAVDPRWVREVLEHGKPARLLHVYGPTESTTYASWYQVGYVPEGTTTVPIGRPLSNTQLYVLDQQLQVAPIGVPAELYIGGDGLAREYLNSPELTAERFIPDPFKGQPGSRLYKTGDVVRYLADGAIEFVGRRDEQVKVRGYRIEIGEIEAVLSQHPTLDEVIVLLQHGTSTGKQLMAYVVSRKAPAPAESELRDYLRGKLPDYMVPRRIVKLDMLPLTPNGKVDRQALSELALIEEREETESGPRTSLEQMLLTIWQSVLGLSQLGIYQNFFEIGGHSLLATQVVSRIREKLHIEMPLRVLFEVSTIAELAAWIEQAQQHNQRAAISLIVPASRNQALPLSFAQQRLWFLYQLDPQSSAYNIPSIVRLQGSLNIVALQQSLVALEQRHESLRTTFAEKEGRVSQRINEQTSILLPIIDLRSCQESQREEVLQKLIQQKANTPFNLNCGPVWRACLLQLEEHAAVLLLTMHHIVSDGWSMEVLLRDLTAYYHAFLASELPALAPLSIQYADYALWQRQWLQGELLKEHIRYWTSQLSEASALELPTDHPRQLTRSNRGGRSTFRLDSQLTQALVQLSRQEGVTLFMTLLTGFQVLLYRLSGQHDVVVGTDSANRSRIETEDLIGFFVNLLALRARIDGKQPFRELLREVRETVLGAYAHQELPFEMLVEHLRLQRMGNRTPLVNVLFVMQNVPTTHIELPDLVIQPVDSDASSAKFDLALFVTEELAGLDCWVNYSTDLFTEETVVRMMSHYEMLLRGVVAHPEMLIDNLETFTSQEKQLRNTRKEKRLAQHLSKLKDFKEELTDLSS